jgi:hypothetical protein
MLHGQQNIKLAVRSSANTPENFKGHKMYVLIPAANLSAIFLTLRRIEQI